MTTGKPAGQAQPAGKKATPAAAPAAPRTSPTKPATSGHPASKSPPTGKKKSDDGDPFDVDTSAARKAAPVRPKPAKGYMVRVTCPMCERAGFISEAEIGKEVKCCNPECLVPVFVANAPRKAEPEPEPAAEGGNKLFLIGGLGVVAIGIAIAATFLLKKKPEAGGPVTIPRSTTQNPDTDPNPTGPDQLPQAVQPQVPQALSHAEVIARALTEMTRSAELGENARDRALSTRVLSESLVLQGEFAKAQQAVSGLSGASQYAAIAPWVTQAWRQLAAGDQAGAKQAADAAWALRESLATRGRESLDLAADLTAVMVATGRTDEARQFVAPQQDREDGGMITLWRAAIEGMDYRFDLAADLTCLQELTHPQWATVTQILAAQGQREAARTWALGGSDELTRDACAALIGAHAARTLGQGPELSAVVDPLMAALPPAGQARVWSAVGQSLAQRGDAAGAAASGEKAASALTGASVQPVVAIPDLKSLFDLADAPDRGLPDPLPGTTAALAAYDLYDLQRRAGQAPAARLSLELALQHLRSTAPSAAGTGLLITELEQDGKGVRERIKTLFQIDDSIVVSRFSRYQQQVRAWHARAIERQDLEVRLLKRAALAGDAQTVWQIVQASESQTDPAAAQTYRNTSLPGLLRELANVTQQAAMAQEITTYVGEAPVTINPTDRIRVLMLHSADPANWKPLVLEITPYYERPPADRAAADAAVLALVSRTFEKAPLAALALTGQLPETLLREDALWLMGARSVATNQARQVMEKFDPRSFPKAAAAMFYRGCVDAATREPSARQ